VPTLMLVLVAVLVLLLVAALLVTVAAKASFAPARIVAVAGFTLTPALPPSGGSVEPSLPRFVPRPEQPLSRKIRSTACVLQRRFTDITPIGPRLQTALR
jgi:hypothetical protein